MAAEFKIGRLRFTWAGRWEADKFYNRDAVIEYNGKTYVCVIPHTSDTNFYNDLKFVTLGGASTPYWELNLEGIQWLGDWTTGYFYSQGNIVVFGGATFKCILEHTSSTFDADVANWQLYSSSDKWNNEWQTAYLYGIGDVVKYGGIIYRCNTLHTSASTALAGLELDQSKWTAIVEQSVYRLDWATSTRYRLNDIVKLGADLYIATSGHESTNTFDPTKWNLWLPGVEYSTTWADAVTYQPGDIVVYGGYSYVSSAINNLANIPSTVSSNWDLLTTGYSMQNAWSNGQEYLIGSVVRRGSALFVAIADNSGQDPTSYAVSKIYVELDSSGTVLNVNSVAGITPGMIVSGVGFTQGQTVVSVEALTNTVNLSAAPDNTLTDSQPLEFIGVNYVFWSLIARTSNWTGPWQAAITYIAGDIAVWANGTYKCIKTHLSAENIRPDVDLTKTYWILEAPHARRNAGTSLGDIVTRNDTGNIPVAIGEEDYILRASNTLPSWATLFEIPDVFYVAPDGVDDADHGRTWDKAWASIKHACEQISAGFNGQNSNFLITSNKEFLVNEMYAWMLYQKANSNAPFSPASVFDEYSTKRDADLIIDALSYDITRGGNSRTVAAAQSYFSSENFSSFRNEATDAAQLYIVASLEKLAALLLNVVSQTFPSTNYQETNITWNSTTTYVIDDIVFYNDNYYQSATDDNLNEVPAVSENWTSIANPGIVTPQVTDGTKQKENSTDQYIIDLMAILTSSIAAADSRLIPQSFGSSTATIMLKTGTYSEDLPITVPDNVAINGDELRGAVVQPKNSLYTASRRSFSSTNTFLLDSVEYLEAGTPIQFSVLSLNDAFSGIGLGNTYYVKTINTVEKSITVSDTVGGAEVSLANGQGIMTVYAGNCLKDMFYVLNASGIRNVTLTGLAGSLTTPNNFGTSRPTGGAYVSLSPGSGPEDTSVWITKRSPYIQNVTTFGVGATGLKIDGYLHGGGNRSITCNDFTQIISDGIGVWCIGTGALTECVSVFSYYAYTSYYAEDGGRIRATNGNSSYGTYGVIAEGFDPTEDPISGQIDNQSSQVQANVQSAFGSQAQILTLAYNNAGSGYFEQTTNLLNYSNNFEFSPWTTDGNVTVQQNLASPIGETNGWTLTGLTSSTDSSFIYQDISIPPAGAEYIGLDCLNVTGTGNSATFDVTVSSTVYFAQVNAGGTGYVVGSVVRVLGSQLGGKDGVNDCFLTISSLAGSSILGVTVEGVVPEGSAQLHTFSIYAKKGTASSFDMELIYSGYETVESSINFNFDTLAITSSNNGTNGLVPTLVDKLSLSDGWYRIWLTVYDTTALNTSARVKIYPRSRVGFAGYSRFYGAQLQLAATPTFYLETLANRFTSYADYFVKGAGTGVIAVGDETRSKSVFQTRITDTGTGQGGRGYLVASNNAQGGDDVSILLSGSDVNLAINYQTMRVFVNSGTGAGQYGYISYFDDGVTKQAYVMRESFDAINVIASDSATDQFQTGDAVYSLYTDQPVQFIPTYYSTTIISTSLDTVEVTETIGGVINTLTLESTSKLSANMTIRFIGSVFGGVVTGFTYYIKEVIDDTTITIATTPFGTALLLNSVVGTMTMQFPGFNSYIEGPTSNMIPNMPITFTGTSMGGIAVGTQYYINDVVGATEFTIATSLIQTTITNTATVTNIVTTSGSTSGLISLYPIVFSGVVFGGIVAGQKYYVEKIINSSTFTITSSLITVPATATTTGSNLITVSSTAGFEVDTPILFRGNTFGNIVNETIYYIQVINSLTEFTVSLSPGGSAVNLTTATGNVTAVTSSGPTSLSTASGSMTATSTNTKQALSFAVGSMNGTYSTSLFGGVVAGTTYYIKDITLGSPNYFTITDAPGGLTDVALSTDAGSMNVGALGWDHINPGTPIEPTLANSSVYFIEPRLAYSAPAFTQSASTITNIDPATSWIGIAYGNNTFMAIASGNATASKTTNGTTWTSVTLPLSTTWTDIAYGNEYWVAISNDSILANTGSSVAISNSNGTGWRLSQLPSKTTWSKVVYGNGVFVAIANLSSAAAYSLDFGKTWNSASGLPNASWTSVAYGSGRFVAVASGTDTAAYSLNGITWTSTSLPDSGVDGGMGMIYTAWSSITYGAGLFVAVSASANTSAYSRDGITWRSSVQPLGDIIKISYGQGVFLALTNSGTAYISENGVYWHPKTVTSTNYGAIQFGFVESTGDGIFVTAAAQTTGSVITAGCTTKSRVSVTSGRITGITIWEAGSNYLSVPTLTITDPNITVAATTSSRISNGVLGNPTFVNRGQDYNTNSTTIRVNGGGYADTFQTGLTIIVKNLTALPGPGDNLTIAGNSKIYKVTSATVVFGTTAPNIKANIQISPDMTVALSPSHETAITIRTKYSQVRLTGHDFLNIGYGNFTEANYPNVPVDTILAPQDQAIEINFGRVFYTSTDQDGNFKVGDLFGVEQATGIVTLSASQFGLQGLETLSLGGISVGGSSVVVRQFSTDSTFISNSNEIIPTQRAIKSYLSGRLSQGGSNTFTGQLIAGTVLIGGPDKISSTIPNGTVGSVIEIPVRADIDGQFGAWDGDGAALALFFKSARTIRR